MNGSTGRIYTIPLKPMPKKRPRAAKGRMFMPHDYQKWKSDLRDHISGQSPEVISGNFVIEVKLLFPTRPRGDLDNILGAVLDAIQPPRAKGDVRAQRDLEAITTLEERLVPGCLIVDDKLANGAGISWVPSPYKVIQIEIHPDSREPLTGKKRAA